MNKKEVKKLTDRIRDLEDSNYSLENRLTLAINDCQEYKQKIQELEKQLKLR